MPCHNFHVGEVYIARLGGCLLDQLLILVAKGLEKIVVRGLMESKVCVRDTLKQKIKKD
jgi:hypothetical protein